MENTKPNDESGDVSEQDHFTDIGKMVEDEDFSTNVVLILGGSSRGKSIAGSYQSHVAIDNVAIMPVDCRQNHGDDAVLSAIPAKVTVPAWLRQKMIGLWGDDVPKELIQGGRHERQNVERRHRAND